MQEGLCVRDAGTKEMGIKEPPQRGKRRTRSHRDQLSLQTHKAGDQILQQLIVLREPYYILITEKFENLDSQEFNRAVITTDQFIARQATAIQLTGSYTEADTETQVFRQSHAETETWAGELAS